MLDELMTATVSVTDENGDDKEVRLLKSYSLDLENNKLCLEFNEVLRDMLLNNQDYFEKTF